MNINIAPVKFSNSALIDNILNEMNRLFYAGIKRITLPVDIEKYFDAGRNQYYSTQIIADVIPLTKEIPGKVVLLTEADLFVPVLTFVFGEAQLKGKHSIVSLCRLHEEFYYGKSDDKLLFNRLMKEILHELGHNFGLIHCHDWDCVMHSSMGIEEVDIKGSTYCRQCAREVEGFKKI